jgi:serine/threonine protein kinase
LSTVDKALINDVENDLLTKMLEKDPSNRITAAKCLEHNFF